MSKLEFTCPKCGEHRIEEVMIDVVVMSEIINLDSDGDFNYGEQTNDGGIVDSYSCMNCGLTPYIEDETHSECDVIDSHDDLVKWIKINEKWRRK